MKMKRVFVLMLAGMLAVAAQAVVIDDFSGNLNAYTNTVILDANGGGSNTATWQITDGKLEYNTTSYDGIEQAAFIISGYTLDIGAELQVQINHIGNQDIGLYVGGTAPTTGVRESYVNVYARNDATKGLQVLSRGFTYILGGSHEMNLKGDNFTHVVFDTLFIKRDAVHDFEAGYYNGSTRVVIADRNGLTDIDGSYIGFYSDVRAAGVLGAVDNLTIVSEPTNPSVVQTQDGTNNVDVLLQWNAASDPMGGISGLAVDPDISAQYVFVGHANDPNLYYKGATGDPGNTPASSFDLQDSVQNDSTYRWAVVEAMSGHEQALTVDSSTLNDVDPNNTVGPIWTFDSLVSIPIITQQPANVRTFGTDPSVVLTCEFTSVDTATVLWYKGGVPTPLTTGGNIVVNTIDDGNSSYVSTLEILTPAFTDEGEYYCTIDNGTPLLTSNAASLVIKRLLARYDFDGTLAPAAGSEADAPTGQGKSLEGLTEPNSLAASNVTLTFVEGIDGAAGHAVRINLNQFIDFGAEGYPKAYAALSNGYGGGLDEGTVIFWVKPDVDMYQIILGNFNDTASGTGFLAALQADQDFDLLVRSGGTYLANHVAGRPNRPEYDLTDGNWHLMAACWGGNTSALYVDGQPVASNTNATPASYDAWQRGILLGATRLTSNRDFLTDMFAGGAIDNLRIYNYRLDAQSNDVFAQEYLDATGIVPCLDSNFTGNEFNFDNTGSSYCTVNLADFAVFASAWLESGLYVAP
jgi:hypothetical protein